MLQTTVQETAVPACEDLDTSENKGLSAITIDAGKARLVPREIYSYEQVLAASLEYFNGDKLAATVFVGKYALQNEEGQFLEKTPADMHRRLAKEFARIEAKYPNGMSENEIFALLSDWRLVPQGSPMSGVGNPYRIQTFSNCYVVESPHDSYGGILHTDQQLTQIMKRRGGVGVDISTIRPQGLPTSNAARTTDGLGVFMERFSNTTREVAQGGRRGALMTTVSVHHPDIYRFIQIKNDLTSCKKCGHEERTRVTGSNVSVRLTDEFREAVEAGTEVELRWPVDAETPKISRWVDARSLWEEIIKHARDSAEPGLLFWDNILRESPADIYSEEGFRTVCTNPCLTGDTLVAVSDGRGFMSFKELAEKGQDVPVYARSEDGRIVVRTMRNPHVTAKSQKILKITLDDGTTIRCTENHKFLLRSGVYAEAQEMSPGDSLHIGYRYEDKGSFRLKNCEQPGSEMLGSELGQQVAYARSLTDMPLVIREGAVFVQRACEHCGDEFSTALQHRGQACCSLGCQTLTHAREEASRRVKTEQTRVFSDLNWSLGREPFQMEWERQCEKEEIPFGIPKNGFRSYGELKSASADYNHRVVSIEEDGYEDVYNGSVDEVHNYYIGGELSQSKYGKPQRVLINSKNCAELPLSVGDSCRLLLVNLTKFVRAPFTDETVFDFEAFHEVARKAQRLMDDLVDLELEQIDKVLAKIESDEEPDFIKDVELKLWTRIRTACANGRRTGLGVTGVGDTVAMLNTKYGSKESIGMIGDLYKSLAIASYTESIHLAEERGSFPVFDLSKETGHPYLSRILAELDPADRALYEKYGRRQIANLTTAPTGSVSLLTQTTGGIEPVFQAQYIRRKKINPNDQDASVDFVDAQGDKFSSYVVSHHGLQHWKEVTGYGDDSFEKSPYFGAQAAEIDWESRVNIQASAGQWVDHSISSTVNLPRDVDYDTVRKIYEQAWKSGCKGITVYRDGCRDGVLIGADETDQMGFLQHDAPKRPDRLPCEVHRCHIKIGEDKEGKPLMEDWTFFVGLLEGKPFEIFGGTTEMVELPRKVLEGHTVKRSFKTGGKYDFHYGDLEDPLKIKNIVKQFDNPDQGYVTRMISLSLRHGSPIQYVVEQLQRDKDADMFAFSRCIARVLKKYIPDGVEARSEKICGDCGAEGSLRYQEGCVLCSSCGASKCG